MYATRPRPIFGYPQQPPVMQSPGLPPQLMQQQLQQQQGMPPQMLQQQPPQMPPQMAQPPMGQPGMPPGQPGLPPGMALPPGMQLPPQLLAQLAQLHGMGLGGGVRPQQPMFGRQTIQPINAGAYSLR